MNTPSECMLRTKASRLAHFQPQTRWRQASAADPLSFQREKRVPDLQPGRKPEEVAALIGAPDFITPEGWEYDLDGDPTATLVIRWRPDGCEKPKKTGATHKAQRVGSQRRVGPLNRSTQ